MTKLAMRRKGISGTAEVYKQPFQLPSDDFTALVSMVLPFFNLFFEVEMSEKTWK
jgi:hypothetical protein